MAKPSVTILHYTAAPIVGGVENVIAQHECLLSENGYPVKIVAGRGATKQPSAVSRTVVVPEMYSQHPRNLQIGRELAAGRFPTEFDEFEGRIEAQLEPILRRSDIVMVHNVMNFHFNLPLTAALHSLLDRGAIRNLVAWCHDISDEVNPASGYKQFYGFPWDLLRTYRPEISYVTVSTQRQHMLASILGCAEEQIRVIPNGVDPAVLLGLSDSVSDIVREFHLLDADLVVLMPVRITHAKNIEFALRVIAALNQSGLSVRLIVTGPPDPHDPDSKAYYETLLALRDELGLYDQVVFAYGGTSHLPAPLNLTASMVAELYRISDLVFMPSYHEGFGLPIFEGGLVGKPLFTTDVPALAEVEENSVYFVAADDSPEQVAERMASWADSNPEHRLRVQVRQKYTWTTIFDRDIQPLILELARRERTASARFS